MSKCKAPSTEHDSASRKLKMNACEERQLPWECPRHHSSTDSQAGLTFTSTSPLLSQRGSQKLSGRPYCNNPRSARPPAPWN